MRVPRRNAAKTSTLELQHVADQVSIPSESTSYPVDIPEGDTTRAESDRPEIGVMSAEELIARAAASDSESRVATKSMGRDLLAARGLLDRAAWRSLCRSHGISRRRAAEAMRAARCETPRPTTRPRSPAVRAAGLGRRVQGSLANLRRAVEACPRDDSEAAAAIIAVARGLARAAGEAAAHAERILSKAAAKTLDSQRSDSSVEMDQPKAVDSEVLSARWERLTDAQRDNASAKSAAIAAAVDDAERQGIPLRDACESQAEGTQWSGATLLACWYGRDRGKSLADYPRRLWPLILAPHHLGRTAYTEIDPAAWQAFLADYLRPEQPPLAMCYRTLRRLAATHGWTIPRSAAALKRRLDREMPPEAVILARQGPEALARRRPAQVRDRSSLRALEAVNADAHRMDVFVRWPDGKVERPMLVAWQDIHSPKILSWRIDRTENMDGYRLSFADLLRDYGIPQHVFVDNGRAIAAKGLTGGTANRYRFKVKRDEPLGLLTQLVGSEGIHWTTPYHGQSKPIERAFRDLATDIAKDIRLRGAYTGNKPDAKPENYRSKAVPLEKFLEVLEDGIRQHNARHGRRGAGLDGRSFDEAFRESYERHAADIPRPTEAQLTRWLLGAVGITAHRETGAVHLFGNRYWSERLAETLAGRSAEARQVVVRFDPDHLDRPVTVETLDGKLIARAEAQDAVRFLDTQAAREQARDQSRLKRNAREGLDIHRRMAARDLDALLNAADAETREDEQRPAAKVVGGAFGRTPARSMAAKADEVQRMVSGGDEVILEVAERVLPMRSAEDDEEEEWAQQQR